MIADHHMPMIYDPALVTLTETVDRYLSGLATRDQLQQAWKNAYRVVHADRPPVADEYAVFPRGSANLYRGAW